MNAKQNANGHNANVGQNWAAGSAGDAYSLLGVFILCIAPTLCQFLAVATDAESAIDLSRGVHGFFVECLGGASDFMACASTVAHEVSTVRPTWDAARFIACFFALAAVLDRLPPGPICTGPVTQTGHVPKYVDNALIHCLLFSLCFVGGSLVGLYDLGVIYDIFPSMVLLLSVFGFLLGGFLNWKGLHYPSTADSGTTGSYLNDFKWGTELYPCVLGLDVKRFINCRVGMTLWQLAGVSFTYRSYTIHGHLDYGLVFSALSVYLYLVKFFAWEIGYMRSIDIIVDRAGFEIQWGCLVWVSTVYTQHARMSVRSPSGLPLSAALALFAVSLAGVALNYYADWQRMRFRETDGRMTIRGRKARYVEARYVVSDAAAPGGSDANGTASNGHASNGKASDGQASNGNGHASNGNGHVRGPSVRVALLLADGMWGPARHFHYVFELLAAWSWCALANPLRNGLVTCSYGIFLTLLLAHRAKRDEEKCLAKYGDDYRKLMALVPARIVPGIF